MLREFRDAGCPFEQQRFRATAPRSRRPPWLPKAMDRLTALADEHRRPVPGCPAHRLAAGRITGHRLRAPGRWRNDCLLGADHDRCEARW